MKKNIMLICGTSALLGLAVVMSGSVSADYQDPSYNGVNGTGGNYKQFMKGKFNDVKEKRDELRGEIKNNVEGFKHFRDENIQEIRNNWNNFHETYGRLKDYLKPELTEEEIETIKQMHREHQLGAREIFESYKSQLLSGDEQVIEDIIDDFISLTEKSLEDVRPYIDEEKLDEFDAMSEKLIEMVTENKMYRIDNFAKHVELRKDIEHKKKVLSDSLRKSFEEKLDKIPDDKKEIIFKKILDRVDSKKEKLLNADIDEKKKTKLLDVLDEIKHIVIKKLEELNIDQSDAEELIEEIIEGI